MKDIARELNLSITTVSFVVNGKSEQKSISAATVKKVNDLVKKWSYNPNSAARILRTGKSKIIGLIVEDISSYFFGNVAKIIQLEAHKNGYSIFFSSTENNNDSAKELINKMKTSSVDGLIITATTGIKNEIKKLKKENIPFVLLDRLVPGLDVNNVTLNNYKGAFELARHLLHQGYSNIGFISIVSSMSQMADRKNGVVDALAEASIKISQEAMLELSFGETDQHCIAAIKAFIASNDKLDALFFGTNYLGVYGIEALRQCNLKIPSDIAVVCFGDNDIFRLLTPSITVAAQPIKEIATHSIELLLDMINNGQKRHKAVSAIIDPLIIVRDSSPEKAL